MCRLFGFRSIFSSQIHTSLVEADNALMSQSEFHSDGWGVAYYVDNTPHVIKSVKSAIDDSLFSKLSSLVRSETVVAHLRKATQGSESVLNCHPFQYGKWIFAHNGNLTDFRSKKEKLVNELSPCFKNSILGETDSEVLFYLLLTKLKLRENSLIEQLALQENLQETLDKVISIFGDFAKEDASEASDNFLSFIMTDGKQFLVFNGGKNIYYSTHKLKCPEASTCPHYDSNCESPAKQGDKVQHLLVSSEVIENENIWKQLKRGELLFLNNEMKLSKFKLKI